MSVERVAFERADGGWIWKVKDSQGRIVGHSHRVFSSRNSCEHNASLVASRMRQWWDIRRVSG